MIRLKIMYLPFLYLKNGFGEGTTEIASRSQLTQNTLAAACYPCHPLRPHSQHVPCQPVLVLSAASLASVNYHAWALGPLSEQPSATTV